MDEELYHHGIKGMKWGVRRTPEQLGHRTSAAKRKKSSASKKAEREKKREAKRNAAAEAVRQKKLSNAKSLYKHRNEFSQEEIDRALKRFEWEKKLRDYSRDELSAPKRRVDIILGYADTAIRGYNTAARILNAFNDNNSQIPYINQGKKGGQNKENEDDDEKKRRNKGNN